MPVSCPSILHSKNDSSTRQRMVFQWLGWPSEQMPTNQPMHTIIMIMHESSLDGDKLLTTCETCSLAKSLYFIILMYPGALV